MSMNYKHATGTRAKDNTRLGDSGAQYGYIGEYVYEVPNTEPTDSRSAAKGVDNRPYTNWKAKYYSSTRRQNKGGAGSIDEVGWKWYRHAAVWKLRKLAKRADTKVYGAAPATPNTRLWDA